MNTKCLLISDDDDLLVFAIEVQFDYIYDYPRVAQPIRQDQLGREDQEKVGCTRWVVLNTVHSHCCYSGPFIMYPSTKIIVVCACMRVCVRAGGGWKRFDPS